MRSTLLMLLLVITLAATARAESILIRGGTILTASHGTVEGDVLVVDGKIAAISRSIDAPQARVIDARGKFVMPGIIDAHSHLGVYPWTYSSSGNSDGNEATSPLSPDVRAEDSVYLDDPGFERARAGGVTSALILPGSANLIGGEGVVLKLRQTNTLDGMRFQGAPRQLKMAMGENPKRVYGGRTQLPSTRMGNLALLREAYLAAMAPDAPRSPFQDEFFSQWPFRPGHRQVLRDVVAKKVRLQVHCYTKSDIQGLLRVADECGFEVAAIHHALEAYKVADELAKRKIGVATFADWWGFKQEAWDAIPENAALCAKAGVKVAIHSDSADHIQRLYHEAAKCVRHGMPEADAIKAVTLWPAELLGVGDRTGSIDVGKDADIAIFSKHPFDMFARVETTLVDGAVVFERKDRTEPAPAREPAAIALVGGKVVTVSGPVHEGGVVVVRKGRIEAVGAAGTAVPADAVRVDVTGKTIVPGMIDANTHVGLIEVGMDASTHDADESSKIVVPHMRVSDGIHPDSETLRVTRAGGVTTVVVAPGEENLIAGQAAVIDLDGATVADMVVKEPVAVWMSLGGAAIGRGRGKGEFMTRMGLIAQLRELFIQVQEHRRKLDRAKLEAARYERGAARRARKALEKAAAAAASATAMPAGATATATAKTEDEEEPPLPPEPPGRNLRLEALLPVLDGQVPVVVSVHLEADIRAAIALADEFGLKLILNHATEGYRVAKLLAERKIPVIVGPVTTQPSSHETWGAIYENAALLHKAGVKIAMQSDSAHNARLVPFQAGLAVAYGLPPEAALRAVTLEAAEVLGIAADYGSIERGKVANLVVLTGDPLQPLSRIERVYIRGREVPPTSHQTELRDRYGGPKTGEAK